MKNLNKVILLVIFLLIISNSANAGTNGQELSSVYEKFSGIIGGFGGKLIALISGVFGVMSCVMKFNPGAIFTFFGTAIGVGSISFIVDSTVTALLFF